MSKCEHLNWSYDAYQKHWVCEDCHHRANEPYTTLARYASTITEDLSRGRTVSFTGPPDPSDRRTPADRAALADALYHQLVIVYDALAQCDPSARERAIGKRTRDILERAKKERGNE